MLAPEDKHSLVEALDDLSVEATYERKEKSAHWMVSLPLLRAECVKLATKLSSDGYDHEGINFWMNVGRSDPLPEVRYALTD